MNSGFDDSEWAVILETAHFFGPDGITMLFRGTASAGAGPSFPLLLFNPKNMDWVAQF